MSNYQLADTQKQIRITLNLSVDDDFIAQNINWGKVLELNDYEQVESVIEDIHSYRQLRAPMLY